MTDTRDIAEEGLKLLQSKLGTTAFLEIFGAVRQDILEKRRERKMKRSLEVVTDPERAAKKKIHHHEQVREPSTLSDFIGKTEQEEESREIQSRQAKVW